MNIISKIVIGSLLMTTASYADGISGSFVGKSENSAGLLQIVETDSGHLTGRFEQITIQPDGKTTTMNASLTGVRNGETVIVTIKAAQFLSGSISASGTYRDGVLHLTGGGDGFTITWNLNKADEADFRSQAAVLSKQAAEISLARSRSQLVQQMNELTREMNAYASKIDQNLAGFTPTEQRYRLITENMRVNYSRSRSIYDDRYGQASVARGQMIVDITQASIEAEQLHSNVESASQNFETRVAALNGGYTNLHRTCPNVVDAPPDVAELHTACQVLSASAKAFQRSVVTTRSAFVHIEQVWQGERIRQENIVQAANASH